MAKKRKQQVQANSEDARNMNLEIAEEMTTQEEVQKASKKRKKKS
ncbi:hypothetical protein [Vallitalea okinawensis]|nr:hypothetical protein [Vallitalea okinawensis]